MNTIYLDIETIPSQSPEYAAEVRKNITAPAQYKKPESIQTWIDENGDEAAAEIVAKTSFDPAHGHICGIGFAIEDDPIRYLSVPRIETEATAIKEFFDALPKLGMNRFVGHYISGFDLRFILCRAVVLGVPLPGKGLFPRDIKPWSDEVFDTMIAWAGPRDRISQDNLCKALGIPLTDDIKGADVAQAWAEGRHDEIADHCIKDVEKVRAIHRRFEAVGF